MSVYVCVRACQEGKESETVSQTERKREESLQSVCARECGTKRERKTRDRKREEICVQYEGEASERVASEE